MTRRPIPFSGSAFFFGPAPAPGGRVALGADAKRPGQGAPVAAALCRVKAPARSRTKGQEAPGTTPSPLRFRTPIPRAERDQLFLSLCTAPSPSSAPVLPGEPPRRGSAMCPARPDPDSLPIRADRGGSSVRLGFFPRSGSENCPLPLIVPHSASALLPSSGPRACGQKSPGSSGAKHEKGKSKGRLGEGSA